MSRKIAFFLVISSLSLVACTKIKKEIEYRYVEKIVDDSSSTSSSTSASTIPTTNQMESLESLIKDSNYGQSDNQEIYQKIKLSLKNKLFVENLSDEDIQVLVRAFSSGEKGSGSLKLIARMMKPSESEVRSGYKDVLNQFINQFKTDNVNFKVNTIKFLISYFQHNLSPQDFKQLIESSDFANAIAAGVDKKTFGKYLFLESIILDDKSLFTIFKNAFDDDEVLLKDQKDIKLVLERGLHYWSSNDLISLTRNNLELVAKWCERASSLEALDLANKIYEKSSLKFENGDLRTEDLKELVIDRQIRLNQRTVKFDAKNISFEDLSLYTIITILKQNKLPQVLNEKYFRNKKETLLRRFANDSIVGNYRSRLLELELVKVELMYSENKQDLNLVTKYRDAFLKALTAHNERDYLTNKWPPVAKYQADALFDSTEIQNNELEDVISLSNQDRFLSPAVWVIEKDTVLDTNGGNLFFHPLTLILTKGKKLTIKAKELVDPFVDLSGVNGKDGISSCDYYERLVLPEQVGGIPDSSLVSCNERRNQISREMRSITRDKCGSMRVNSERIDINPSGNVQKYSINNKGFLDFLFQNQSFDGGNASSAGSLTLNVFDISNPVLLSLGGTGGDGGLGCRSKRFSGSSPSYQKFFEGQLSLGSVGVSFTCYDGAESGANQYVTVPKGSCILSSTVTARESYLYRIESGSGGKAGNGGDVSIRTSSPVALAVIFSAPGVPGSAGTVLTDDYGPRNPNVSAPQRGKDGLPGKIIIEVKGAK